MVANSSTEACWSDTTPEVALAFDEGIGSGWDVVHTPIDASDSFVADCTSMLGTSAAAWVPAGEHTLVGHGHDFAATRQMLERPTGAYGRSGGKVVACVRLPRP